MYEIEFSVKAAKTYLNLPKKFRGKIDKKLNLLAENPYMKHNNAKPLKGMSSCYRLRIGDWRIIYEVINNKLKIYVIKIGLRKEVYKQ